MRSAPVALLFVAGAVAAQTCVPLTRADVYSLPRDALEHAYCAAAAETEAAMKQYKEALDGPGFNSIQFKLASARMKACVDAQLQSDTLFQERYGKPSPDCSKVK